jgi:hypothetical protein
MAGGARRQGHGLPHGDVLAKIKTGEAAARRDYRAQIVAEILTGKPQEDGFINAEMQWGIEQEPSRAAPTRSRTDARSTRSAWCCTRRSSAPARPRTAWSAQMACTGLVEIKCPKTATHLQYLMDGAVPRSTSRRCCGRWPAPARVVRLRELRPTPAGATLTLTALPAHSFTNWQPTLPLISAASTEAVMELVVAAKPRLTYAQVFGMKYEKGSIADLIERFVKEMDGFVKADGEVVKGVRPLGYTHRYVARRMQRAAIAQKLAVKLKKSDVIEHCRARANENVCPSDRQSGHRHHSRRPQVRRLSMGRLRGRVGCGHCCGAAVPHEAQPGRQEHAAEASAYR